MLRGMNSDHLRRREALIALGGLGLGAAFGARSLLGTSTALAAPECLLQREVTEGPYYLDLDLVRRNIKGNRRGTPLSLRFTVVDASTCRRIQGAAVEIWHADAAGVYSGVSGNTGNFLRGIQRTNSSGLARFETIFPGWYRGRTPHIHTSNAADMIYGEAGARALCSLKRKGSLVSSGYTGSMTIGIQT